MNKELGLSLSATCRLIVTQGDITSVGTEAIVNAANERMLGGGGVDGSIHRVAGHELLNMCRKIPEVKPGVRCPAGEARITPGFKLKAKYVIHAVGPIFRSLEKSGPILHSAYVSSLKLANDHSIKSIAFPAISCGVYGYPAQHAAEVAVKACKEHHGAIERIVFVLFEAPVFEAYVQSLKVIQGGL